MNKLATTQNLTYAGIGAILLAFGNAITEYAAGGFPAVNWSVFVLGVITGIQGIIAKGSATTGAQTVTGKPLA